MELLLCNAGSNYAYCCFIILPLHHIYQLTDSPGPGSTFELDFIIFSNSQFLQNLMVTNKLTTQRLNLDFWMTADEPRDGCRAALDPLNRNTKGNILFFKLDKIKMPFY